jgi:hypothetical protein
MKKTLLFFVLFIGIAGATIYLKPSKVNASTQTKTVKIIDDSFDMKVDIEQIAGNQYELAATIELENGSYVVSPYSEDDIYLHFSISIPDNDNLIADDKLLEIPASVPEIDPILNIPVRFIRGTTTYKQKIELTTENDFEVSGLIEFLVEPSCVPYDVEFTASYNSGVMTVKKTKTFISKEYKLNRN